jgi:hypothetical protein
MLKKLILAAALGTLALAAPAFADNDRRGGHRGHHPHFKHHKHFKHHGHGHYYRRPVVVMPPPRVYYAPRAPVYYAPAPVVVRPAPVYPASGVSIRLHFPL